MEHAKAVVGPQRLDVRLQTAAQTPQMALLQVFAVLALLAQRPAPAEGAADQHLVGEPQGVAPLADLTRLLGPVDVGQPEGVRRGAERLQQAAGGDGDHQVVAGEPHRRRGELLAHEGLDLPRLRVQESRERMRAPVRT